MTNTHNDPATLEAIIERLTNDTDGCDLFTVLCILADSLGEFMPDFVNSRLAQDIIDTTQSNPTRSRNRLIRAARIDNRLAEF